MLSKHLDKLTVLAFVLAITLVSGCGSENAGETSGATADQGGQVAAAEFGSKKGDAAANFTLKRLSGGDLTLSDLRGKAVIIDFWDTWCPPCRRAMPHLQEMSETYGDDLVVVGVAFGREGEEKVRTYVQKNGLTFEMVIYNPESSILADYGGIQSIPTTFLIDEQGVIREKWVGGAEKSSYEKAIVAVVGDKTKAG